MKPLDLSLDLFLPTDEEGPGDGNVDPQVLSGSSVKTYLRCGKQWEYAYVLQIKRPPSIKQGLGIAAHEAVAFNFEQKILTYQDLPKEAVADRFSDAWELLAVDIEDVVNVERLDARTGKTTKTRKETKDKAKSSGYDAVFKYQEEVAHLIQPTMVEQEIRFILDGEIEWTGIFDLSDSNNRLRDHKFVSRKPDSVAPYLVPMIGYALGYRQVTKSIEAEVVLDYMVRTAEPYYLPLASGGPISDSQIAAFADIVRGVKSNIDNGIFLPTGLESHACGWCGYNDICPAYRAANAGQNA